MVKNVNSDGHGRGRNERFFKSLVFLLFPIL